MSVRRCKHKLARRPSRKCMDGPRSDPPLSRNAISKQNQPYSGRWDGTGLFLYSVFAALTTVTLLWLGHGPGLAPVQHSWSELKKPAQQLSKKGLYVLYIPFEFAWTNTKECKKTKARIGNMDWQLPVELEFSMFWVEGQTATILSQPKISK